MQAKIRLLILTVVWGAFATAQSAPLAPIPSASSGRTASPRAVPTLKVPLARYRLKNGLTVILHEDHRLPQLVVDLWFRVGSKDEKVRRTGFAHLFEHLMFMGTAQVPNGQFDAIMEAEGGQNNAFTSEDETNYYEFGPANLLETFLFLEADRLATLPLAMTRQKLDIQREVVKNERRQSIENRPYGKVELIVPDHLYPPSHPYHHPVIGSHADLTAARVEDVNAFFKTYYVPSNATLVIVGDFQSTDAAQLIEKYFGWMPLVPEPTHTFAPPVVLGKSERVVVTDQVQLDQVNVVWHAPSLYAPGEADYMLLAALLGGGKSSRLWRALVFEQHIASEVKVDLQPLRWDGRFVIQATAQPGHHAAEIEAAIAHELAALDGARPPTVQEVERARAFVQTRELSQVATHYDLAVQLAQYDALLGDPSELERSLLARFSAPGVSDLAWAAHDLVSKPHLTVVVVPARNSSAQVTAHE